MSPLVYDGISEPVEIAKGRGDLRYSSAPVGEVYPGRALALSNGKTASYGNIFATQSRISAAVMRLMMYSVRVPLKAYRRTGDDSRERLRSGDHAVARAIVDPWERGSQAQLTMSLFGPLLVHGNGLDEVDEGARGVIRFEASDWRFAHPITPFRDRISGWTLNEQDGDREVAADRMLHVAWWSPLGPVGVSPLQQLGVTIGIDNDAAQHQRSMLRHSARPPSAVTIDKDFLKLKPVEREALIEQLRADITATYAGPENSGRPALLPPGLSWTTVGHSAQEAQLIEQRQVAAEEVRDAYVIPPAPKDGKDLAAWRQAIYMDAVAPALVMIEQAFNAQLIRALLREDDVYVEYDFSAVLRGDRLAEVQALREAIQTGLLTPNEGRAIDNRPKSDLAAMDEFYLPRNNLWPVSQPYPKDGMGGNGSAPGDDDA